MKLKRYNLGFGWFGPLEQCDTGEFMLAEEILPVVEYLKNQADLKVDAENTVITLTDKVVELRDNHSKVCHAYWDARRLADQWRFAAIGATAAFFVELAYFLFVRTCI